MLAAFGVDVLDPAVTVRRVWSLATRLPPQARAGGEEWSQESHLLALLCDHLAQLTYATLKIAGSTSVTEPRPIPRPAHKPRAQPAARTAAPRQLVPPGTPSASWMDAIARLSGSGMS